MPLFIEDDNPGNVFVVTQFTVGPPRFTDESTNELDDSNSSGSSDIMSKKRSLPAPGNESVESLNFSRLLGCPLTESAPDDMFAVLLTTNVQQKIDLKSSGQWQAQRLALSNINNIRFSPTTFTYSIRFFVQISVTSD